MIPCAVLSKGSNDSYTYIGELATNSSDTTGTVANAAGGLVSAYYGNQSGIEVKLYRVYHCARRLTTRAEFPFLSPPPCGTLSSTSTEEGGS